MQLKTGTDAPTQPLPAEVQREIWAYVGRRIRSQEVSTGEKVAGFELHLTDLGQIEIKFLSAVPEHPAPSGEDPDNEVNRLGQREELDKNVRP